MDKKFSITHLSKIFPTNDACLEEIKKLRYPKGIFCPWCEAITKHYKLHNRSAYACEFCRHQMYPLTGTIFEKTTTPLRVWFYAMFLMTHVRGKISAKKLQKELGVTYKTAWKMHHRIKKLMKQNHADLLAEPEKVLTVSFFNAFELKVIQKEQTS